MDTIAKKIGGRLKALRMLQGLTQEKFAERCGVNAKYYGAIERGEVNITLQTLAHIIKPFDIAIADFFRFTLTHDPDSETIIAFVEDLFRKDRKRKLEKLKIFLKKIL